VPLVSLLAWSVGLLVQGLRPIDDRPLEVTAAPSSQMPPIVLPPRNRVSTGRLVGHDGAPIEGALVSLVAADEPHWGYTNADGTFRLEGLQRGPWTITFSAASHQPFVTTLPDDGNPATVRLPDAPRVLPTLPWHATSTLRGIVVLSTPNTRRTSSTASASGPTSTPNGPDDTPASSRATTKRSLAGVELLFTPVQPLDEIDAPLPRRTTCDAEGRFVLDDLQVGDYTVLVLPEWAQNGTWPDLSRTDGAPPTRWTQRAGDGSELSIPIVAGGLRGVVADRQGGPIEGALVLVASEALPERVWPPVTADARGAFEVLDLPPGKYVVSVRAGSGSHRSVATVPEGRVVDVALPPLSVERPPAR